MPCCAYVQTWARLIWRWLAITSELLFLPQVGAYREGSILLVSTVHVRNWRSLAARCRIIPKRFLSPPGLIGTKIAGPLRWLISKRQMTSTHATLRSHTGWAILIF